MKKSLGEERVELQNARDAARDSGDKELWDELEAKLADVDRQLQVKKH